MYIINKLENCCSEIERKSFSELGFREREHLQEWFANNPGMFGEELLIIQKEFDGFSETKERLDLLALDKEGNLVIIENKLDDSGRDVTWQSLKYASYCSSLSKENIRSIYQEYLLKNNMNENAEDSISDFLELEYDEIILNQGSSQRIILIAANFRKEVTSTVVWLMNYNLKIKCIKVTPYKLGEQLFLDVNQIIPMKDIEDYSISMMDKQSDEKVIQAKNQTRHNIRIKYWTNLLSEFNKISDLYSRVSPKKDNWLAFGSGISGLSFSLVVAKSSSRVELYIDTGSKDKNEQYYDMFYSKRIDIENKLNHYNLSWQKLDEKNACRISIPVEGNYFEEDNWDSMITDMVKGMLDFHKVMSEYFLVMKRI